MMKKMISLLLATVMVASLALPAAAVNTYSDLETHWAKEEMMELVELGYLNGYEDGTMKPESNITTLEALVFLSRFYSPSEDIVEAVHEEYGEFVSSYVAPTLAWAYDELELCLAAGIITQNELKNVLRLTSDLDKEFLAVFLVRTLDMVSDATNNTTELTFDDTDDITSSYRNYVAVLVDNGIVNGDTNNNFSPKLAVTRAVVSAMVIRSLDLLETNGTELELEQYHTYATYTGLVSGASSTKLQFVDHYGREYSFPLTSEAATTVNGKASTLNNYVGYPVTVTYNVTESHVTTAEVAYDSDVTWVQGKLTSYSPASTGATFYYIDSATGKSTRVFGAPTTEVTLDGAAAKEGDLAPDMMITAALNSDKCFSTIHATLANYTVTGNITTLVLGSTVDFAVTTATGEVLLYPLEIANLPELLRGKVAIAIDQFQIGETVTLTVENGELTTIYTDGEYDTITGALYASSTTSTGTTWTIRQEDGSSYAYVLAPNVTVYQGTTKIDLSSIAIGDTVSVEVANGQIISIGLKSVLTSSSTKISGTIMATSTANQQITLLTASGSLLYINTWDLDGIYSVASNRTMSISNLDVDDEIMAYGAYSSTTTFVATDIIVEVEA